MKFLITGAAGFIGFHLSREILKNPDDIVVGFDNLNDYYDVNLKLSRLNELKKFHNFIFIKGDLSDKNQLLAVFEQYKFDYVVNLAAQAGVRYSIDHPDCYIQSNIVGFYNVLEACRQYPVKHLVYASSSSVYGNQDKVPFSVEDKTDSPVSLYAATKKANELLAYSYCKIYGIKATGLRFFTVYGPWGRPDMAYFHFTESIVNDRPIKLFNNGNMIRDFTYIDDIVKGISSVVISTPQKDENNVYHKVYNIGNNKPVKLIDFVDVLERIIGKKAIIEYSPMEKGDVYITYADIGDFQKTFFFKPSTDLQFGLKEFYKWYSLFYGNSK